MNGMLLGEYPAREEVLQWLMNRFGVLIQIS